uniref:NADH dehydrogenase subunit 4L n=1 Tax=Thetibates serena TaxID=2866982 RepID=UPI001EDDD4F4|nr:NADH dehydrogenase subunit 4L [Thetibates serena]UIG88152.1 NADH dehydrogenase subunit 4L [Thetibates serena]UIG88172.1 NADH dehydrogenase subunit 4L [Thetibates serena]
MLINSFFFWYMFFCGMLIFCSFRKHVLLTLLSLEYLVIFIFFCFFYLLFFFNGEFNFLIIFLTFSICEGVMGLSVLVNMIRTHGNDMLMNLSGLLW